jgi:hypothetical protein
MAYRFTLLQLLLVGQSVIAQPNQTRFTADSIDSLNNDDQVLAFVRKAYANQQIFFHPTKFIYGDRDHERKAREFGAHPYEKADLDNDGYTDLLFNGYEGQSDSNIPLVLVIFCNNGNKLRVERLPDEIFFDFFAAKILRIDDQTCLHALQISRKRREEWRPGSRRVKLIDYTERRSDTLVWFQNCFIERERPVEHHIEKIRYYLGGGSSPISDIRLTIIVDSVKLEKTTDGIPSTPLDSGGVFTCRLDSASRDLLYSLLRYIDFPHLKENYQMRGTDAATGILEITYDRGKKKVIEDYGAMGTYGLAALETLLSGLVKSQDWTKTNAPAPDWLHNFDN